MLTIRLHQAQPDGADPGSSAPAEAPPSVNWDSMADDSLPEEVPPANEDDNPPDGTPPDGSTPPTPPKDDGQQPPSDAKKPDEPPMEETPPQPKQPTAEELAAFQQKQEEQRAAVHAELTKVYEKDLTEDDRAALISDPGLVIPKMLAKATMDAVALALREMQAIAPRIVDQHSSTKAAVDKAWSEFDAAHPDLAKAEYRAAVMSAINTVKQSGRRLSKEQAMAAVARTARALLDLPQPGTPSAKEEKSSAPAAPFVPVGRGNAAARKPAEKKPGTWDQFLDD